MPITSSHQSPMSSTSSVSQHRDYDYLRSQFENAMEQLQVCITLRITYEQFMVTLVNHYDIMCRL